MTLPGRVGTYLLPSEWGRDGSALASTFQSVQVHNGHAAAGHGPDFPIYLARIVQITIKCTGWTPSLDWIHEYQGIVGNDTACSIQVISDLCDGALPW